MDKWTSYLAAPKRRFHADLLQCTIFPVNANKFVNKISTKF